MTGIVLSKDRATWPPISWTFLWWLQSLLKRGDRANRRRRSSELTSRGRFGIPKYSVTPPLDGRRLVLPLPPLRCRQQHWRSDAHVPCAKAWLWLGRPRRENRHSNPVLVRCRVLLGVFDLDACLPPRVYQVSFRDFDRYPVVSSIVHQHQCSTSPEIIAEQRSSLSRRFSASSEWRIEVREWLLCMSIAVDLICELGRTEQVSPFSLRRIFPLVCEVAVSSFIDLNPISLGIPSIVSKEQRDSKSDLEDSKWNREWIVLFT